MGDPTFAAAFNANLTNRTLRYVNHHDIVTHVPPPLFGYKRVDARRFIAADGTISGKPPTLIALLRGVARIAGTAAGDASTA